MKNTIVTAVIASLVVGIGLITFRGTQSTQQNYGSITSPAINSPWISVGNIQTYYTRGSCNTASSTIFSVKNPMAATSTLVRFSIVGQQGATTTDLVVATSSVASPPLTTSTATYSLNENILGAQIAANAQFTSVAGVTTGSATGYLNPILNGFISDQEVGVGPNDYVIGFSTSTTPGGAGGRTAAQVAVPSSCNYQMVWQRSN